MKGDILHPTEGEFDTLIEGKELVLVDFWATWCGPCKMIAPLIEQLATKYEGKIKVAKVDVDEEKGLAARYGIQSIPTIMLFQNGEILAREVGVKPLSNYTDIIDSKI